MCFLCSFWPVQCTGLVRSFGPLKSWLLLVTQEEMTELWRGIEQSQLGLHVKGGRDGLLPLRNSTGATPVTHSDSALGTAEEYVNLSRRSWIHQDFKGAALCLSNPTSRNLTNRELYTTVKKQAQQVCPELFMMANNDKNGTIHKKDPLRRPRHKAQLLLSTEALGALRPVLSPEVPGFHTCLCAHCSG